MLVKHIEIKVEQRDIPTRTPEYKVVRWNKGFVHFIREGEMSTPHPVQVDTETYRIRQIKYPNQDTKLYGVRIGDEDLFSDLQLITDAMVNEKIDRASNKSYEFGFDTGERSKTARFLRLPFWKRLFRKYIESC